MAVGARANAMKLINPETKIRRLDLEVERIKSPAVVCPLYGIKGENDYHTVNRASASPT
jgi:hypothetical protein